MAAPVAGGRPAAVGAKLRASTPPAVLLSKQDFEALRFHALPMGTELLHPSVGVSEARFPRKAFSSPSEHTASYAKIQPTQRPRSVSSRRKVEPRPPARHNPNLFAQGEVMAPTSKQPAREPSPGRNRGPAAPAAVPQRALAPCAASLMPEPSTKPLLRARAASGPSGSAGPTAAPAKLGGGKPPRPESMSPSHMAVEPSAIILPSGRGLQVVAQAAPIKLSERDTPENGVADLNLEDLSEDEDCLSVADGEEPFDYRQYRYKAQESSKAPTQGFAAKRNKSVGRPQHQLREWSPHSPVSFLVPWGSGEALPQRWRNVDPLLGKAVEVTTSPAQDEPQLDPGLERIAKAVISFYRLPADGGKEAPIRYRCNAVMVEEAAWQQRQRESQLEAPPIFWLRGGRVYDFHGDRGTLQEFESDFLVRQVEDDPSCRLRRREQGLMPFPFVAAPLTQKDDEDEPDDKPDSREQRRRRH
mmetsp:Transcript_21259/g.49312  ORF Transcript_21259/g.49312 Transcript_21259/m.49312 type:complete len:472 (+) Transcript_21259:88-1503(+)